MGARQGLKGRVEGAWGLRGSLPLAPGCQLCPPAARGALAALARPREMLYKCKFPSKSGSLVQQAISGAVSPIFHTLCLCLCLGQSCLPAPWRVGSWESSACRLADRPTRQAHCREAGPAAWAAAPGRGGVPPGPGVEGGGGRREPGEKGGSPFFRLEGFWTDGVGEREVLCLGPCLPDLGHPQRAPGPHLTPPGAQAWVQSRHDPPPALVPVTGWEPIFQVGRLRPEPWEGPWQWGRGGPEAGAVGSGVQTSRWKAEA